eukprot:768537-Hanusia_phi.AAC.12
MVADDSPGISDGKLQHSVRQSHLLTASQPVRVIAGGGRVGIIAGQVISSARHLRESCSLCFGILIVFQTADKQSGHGNGLREGVVAGRRRGTRGFKIGGVVFPGSAGVSSVVGGAEGARTCCDQLRPPYRAHALAEWGVILYTALLLPQPYCRLWSRAFSTEQGKETPKFDGAKSPSHAQKDSSRTGPMAKKTVVSKDSEGLSKRKPQYDPEILKALEIDHIPAHMIEATLREEFVSLEDLKTLVDAGFHQARAETESELPLPADQWSEDLVQQLNPKRMFFPGQTYSPEELSPHTRVDYSKIREEKKKKGCPLGGKKGPKIDFTNVALLSRYHHSYMFVLHLVTIGLQQIPHRRWQDYAAQEDICVRKETAGASTMRQARSANESDPLPRQTAAI